MSKRRKRLLWGISLLVVMILGLLLAPMLATRTKVREYLLAYVVPAEAGRVSMEDLHVGWFTPLRISALRMDDAKGERMLEVASIHGDRTLLQLATRPSDLGKLVVTEPKIYAVLRPNGSSLEDVATAFPATESEPVSLPAILLEVVNGKIEATEEATGTTWRIDSLNVTATLPADTTQPWQAKLGGNWAGQSFSLDVAAPLGLATTVWPLGPAGTCKLTADALPLQPIRYAATRIGQSIDLDGSLTADVDFRWETDVANTTSLPRLSGRAEIGTENFQLVAPEIIGKDILRLASAKLSSELLASEGTLTLKNCRFDSALGHAQLSGAARIADLLDANMMAGALRTLRSQQIATEGEFDVAALAQTLPTLFHIHDGMELRSGKVAWSVANQVAMDNLTRWGGWLRTQEVQVTQAGKPIDWQFPLQIEFAVSDGDEISIESLTASSDFFRLAGQGKLQAGRAQFSADLQRLTSQLEQVIDLQGLRCRGDVQGAVDWNADATNQLTANGQAKLTEFELVQGEQVVSREQELKLIAKATGLLQNNTLQMLQTARLDVISAADMLVAELKSPVEPSGTSSWPVASRVRGELRNWQGRLQTLGVDLGMNLGGQIDATAQVTYEPKSTTLHSLQGDIRDLVVEMEGVRVREPIVRFASAGTIDNNTFAANFPNTTLASGSLSLAAQAIVVQQLPSFSIAGDIGFRADLARLMKHIATGAETQSFEGTATGQIRLLAKQASTSFDLSGKIDDFAVQQLATSTTPATSLWQEPSVTIQLQGEYDSAQDQLLIAKSEVASNALRVAAKGSAGSLTTQPVVDVEGDVTYDLETIIRAASSYVGTDIRVVGRHVEPFRLQGPLFPNADQAQAMVSDQLAAQAGVAIDAGNLYGIPLEATRVDGRLSQGKLQLAPIQLAFGPGQIRVAPTLYVNTPQLWMTIEPGLVADHVQITPELCKTWMRFVTPLLADATSAEGTFSVELSKAEVPLMEPMAGKVAGQFLIHGGVLGPGPMSQQLLEIAQQVKQLSGKGSGLITDPNKAWVQLQPQQIGFQMQEGRVYHEGFRMVVDGVPIQTKGTVWLDERLEMVAEVPIMDEWIQATPALSGLRGQMVQVPISGTISQPRLDQRALAQLSGQIVRQAARGYLEQEVGNQIQKQLNKLFK